MLSYLMTSLNLQLQWLVNNDILIYLSKYSIIYYNILLIIYYKFKQECVYFKNIKQLWLEHKTTKCICSSKFLNDTKFHNKAF